MILLQSGSTNFLAAYGPLVLLFVVIYFFFIRPQTKKAKSQQQFVDAMERGDDVVTSSGIFGKVNKIEDNIVTLQVDTKTFIRVAKSAVSREMTESANSTAG